MALQIGERAVFECTLVRRAQHDTRRGAGFKSFLPARRAETPPVSSFESRKSVFRHRRRQVVSRALENARNSSVIMAHTVWLPTSSVPVSQQPLRKKPVTGFDEQDSSVPPNTFRDGLRPRPNSLGSSDIDTPCASSLRYIIAKKSGPRGPLFQVCREATLISEVDDRAAVLRLAHARTSRDQRIVKAPALDRDRAAIHAFFDHLILDGIGTAFG